MQICFNDDKAIVGVAEIMYCGKWYKLLYKNTDYVILRVKGQYIKVDKCDIEDCMYNNTIFDEDGYIRLMSEDEKVVLIERGKSIVNEQYDIFEVYALVNDLVFYRTDNTLLFFRQNDKKQNILCRCIPTTNDGYSTKYCDWFAELINDLISLDSSEKRRGINNVMKSELGSCFYSSFNKILRTHGIYSDSDANKCNEYCFIIDTIKMLDCAELIFE